MLPESRSRSSQGQDLYAHCSTLVVNASCHVWFKLVLSVLEKKIFEGFLPYIGKEAIFGM